MNQADERIATLNPVAGKAGMTIERVKYDAVRAAILAVLTDTGEAGVRFMPSKKDSSPGLMDLVPARLPRDWSGSVGWYVTAVKLDLEARGEIERVPKAVPQRVRLPVEQRPMAAR